METPAAPAAAAPAATTAQTTGGQAAEPGQAADETPCKWCGKITAVLFAGIIAAGVVVIANMVTGGKVAEAWRRATAPEPDPGADEE